MDKSKASDSDSERRWVRIVTSRVVERRRFASRAKFRKPRLVRSTATQSVNEV